VYTSYFGKEGAVMASEPPKAIKIFYCYAREDKELRDELDKHLSVMRHAGKISTWYDREIQPGMDWKHTIDTHLKNSAIILLLVSHHFISSDYCYSVEMLQALGRHQMGQARVIPIILSPVEWQETPLGGLQALPTDGKPITTWDNRNEAFTNIVKGIRMVAETLLSTAEVSGSGLINHVLVLSEQADMGHLLVTCIKQNPIALNATWTDAVEKAIYAAQSGFKYDTVFVDVRENWEQKKWFIFMIRDRYPLIPFVLVGFREVFLSQLEEQDRQYFGHFYFFGIETPLYHLSILIAELLAGSAVYLLSHRGERYATEKRCGINVKEYQVQAPFIQNE
jgi:hypothetical protein